MQTNKTKRQRREEKKAAKARKELARERRNIQSIADRNDPTKQPPPRPRDELVPNVVMTPEQWAADRAAIRLEASPIAGAVAAVLALNRGWPTPAMQKYGDSVTSGRSFMSKPADTNVAAGTTKAVEAARRRPVTERLLIAAGVKEVTYPDYLPQNIRDFLERGDGEADGKVNGYVCEKCNRGFYTINSVRGVTPFMVECRAHNVGCGGGVARSVFYNVDQTKVPGWEWYRPTDEEYAKLSDEQKKHVEGGCLMLRKLDAGGAEKYGYRTRRG